MKAVTHEVGSALLRPRRLFDSVLEAEVSKERALLESLRARRTSRVWLITCRHEGANPADTGGLAPARALVTRLPIVSFGASGDDADTRRLARHAVSQGVQHVVVCACTACHGDDAASAALDGADVLARQPELRDGLDRRALSLHAWTIEPRTGSVSALIADGSVIVPITPSVPVARGEERTGSDRRVP